MDRDKPCRDAVFERDGGKLCCAGKSDLDRARGVFLEEGKLAAGEGLALPQRGGDDAIDAADLVSGRLCFVAGPFPRARNGATEVKSFHGVGEVAHKVGAPQFAVRINAEAELFLVPENLEDVKVFDGLDF